MQRHKPNCQSAIMTRIAIQEKLKANSVDWMENVTDGSTASPTRTGAGNDNEF
jgi:hypothetical protein